MPSTTRSHLKYGPGNVSNPSQNETLHTNSFGDSKGCYAQAEKILHANNRTALILFYHRQVPSVLSLLETYKSRLMEFFIMQCMETVLNEQL